MRDVEVCDCRLLHCRFVRRQTGEGRTHRRIAPCGIALCKELRERMATAAIANGVDEKTAQPDALPILLAELQIGLGNGQNREA